MILLMAACWSCRRCLMRDRETQCVSLCNNVLVSRSQTHTHTHTHRDVQVCVTQRSQDTRSSLHKCACLNASWIIQYSLEWSVFREVSSLFKTLKWGQFVPAQRVRSRGFSVCVCVRAVLCVQCFPLALTFFYCCWVDMTQTACVTRNCPSP